MQETRNTTILQQERSPFFDQRFKDEGFTMFEKKIAIVGMGFVGGAVAYGFNHPFITQQHIDPKLGNSIMDIHDDTDFIAIRGPSNVLIP